MIGQTSLLIVTLHVEPWAAVLTPFLLLVSTSSSRLHLLPSLVPRPRRGNEATSSPPLSSSLPSPLPTFLFLSPPPFFPSSHPTSSLSSYLGLGVVQVLASCGDQSCKALEGLVINGRSQQSNNTLMHYCFRQHLARECT